MSHFELGLALRNLVKIVILGRNFTVCIVKENSGRLSVGLVGKVNGSVLEEVMSRLRIRSDWLTHKGRYRAARAATRN